MTLIVEIEMDNAAFQDGAARVEVGEILDRIVERLPDPMGTTGKRCVRDSNGNTCGTFEVK